MIFKKFIKEIFIESLCNLCLDEYLPMSQIGETILRNSKPRKKKWEETLMVNVNKTGEQRQGLIPLLKNSFTTEQWCALRSGQNESGQ